jgi:hypothetical protein
MGFIKWLGIIIGIVVVCYILLWFLSIKKYWVDYGMSFSEEYAVSLGLDPQEVFTAMLTDFQPKYIRLAANWKDVEPQKGVFAYERLDSFMNQAAQKNVKVVLVIGQKAPRWPECHVPKWYDPNGPNARMELLSYVATTVVRYKDHPALDVWQVENEPFIRFAFGECEGYREDAIYEEIDVVRQFDPDRKILITDSGELGLWYPANKTGDLFGTTLYRIVRTPGGRIVTYDWVPAAFYRLKARLLGIDMKNFWVAELQAEPWFAGGDPHNTSIEEQEETMNPDRLAKHLEYVASIGVDRAYLWGVEWWYFMKVKNNDPRYWEYVQDFLKGNVTPYWEMREPFVK